MSNNNVLFVTSQPAVSDFLYNVFNSDEDLKRKYFIEGTSSTRESAIKLAQEKRPDLIIFLEKTSGMETISSTMYKFRLFGSRVIYISTGRSAGDILLETLVGYGIFDIILTTEITSEYISDVVKNPRDFKDVSILHREVDISDDESSNKNYKIPNIDYLRQFSGTLEYDYLTDPSSRGLNKKPPRINKDADDVSLSKGLFKEKKKRTETKKVNKKEIKKQKSNDLGDMTGDFW